MRLLSIVIGFFLGCRDKNFIPPYDPSDTGTENVENISEDGNSTNENNDDITNSEEEQPEIPMMKRLRIPKTLNKTAPF